MIEELLLALMTAVTALFGGLVFVILLIIKDLWYELGEARGK